MSVSPFVSFPSVKSSLTRTSLPPSPPPTPVLPIFMQYCKRNQWRLSVILSFSLIIPWFRLVEMLAALKSSMILKQYFGDEIFLKNLVPHRGPFLNISILTWIQGTAWPQRASTYWELRKFSMQDSIAGHFMNCLDILDISRISWLHCCWESLNQTVFKRNYYSLALTL